MKKIVILGGGESGCRISRSGKGREGFRCFLSDSSKIKPIYKDLLNKYNIKWEEERHTEEVILSANEVIKSPGIPDKAPIIKKIKEKQILLFLEIEFAGR